MADEEGELAEPAKPWSTPPERGSDDEPFSMSTSRTRFSAAPPSGPGPARMTPQESIGASGTKPSDFATHASKMGREISNVPGIFRAGAVLLLVGALIVAGQNALIVSQTTSIAIGGQGLQSPSNASSANGTVNNINATASTFLTILSIATTLDLVGFSLMAVGCFLLAIGSLRIDCRVRFDNTVRKIGKSAFGGFLIGGIFLFAWVGVTATWRAALTGSPTGNWSALQSILSSDTTASGGGLSPALQNFISAFPAASVMWLMATMMLLPAAIGIFVGCRGIRRATAVKVGGTTFLVFAVMAMVSAILFMSFITNLLSAVEQGASGGGGGGGFESAYQDLVLALAIKLFVVPLWAIIGSIGIAITGGRLMRFKPGKVILSAEDIKAITSAVGPTTGQAPAASAGYSYPPPMPEPPKPNDNIMVSLPGAAVKPRLDGAAPPPKDTDLPGGDL